MALWKQEAPPKLRSNLGGDDVKALLAKTYHFANTHKMNGVLMLHDIDAIKPPAA
jgi:hypothetical protein